MHRWLTYSLITFARDSWKDGQHCVSITVVFVCVCVCVCVRERERETPPRAFRLCRVRLYPYSQTLRPPIVSQCWDQKFITKHVVTTNWTLILMWYAAARQGKSRIYRVYASSAAQNHLRSKRSGRRRMGIQGDRHHRLSPDSNSTILEFGLGLVERSWS